MSNGISKNIKEIFEERYVVPLYQRNFTWGKEQIEQLLQDIFDAYKNDKNGAKSNYYIGTLVVIRRRNGVFEVIDGQQRLTVLSLIAKLLGVSKKPCLYYDSRPEVIEFFDDFYSERKDFRETSQTDNLISALSFIENAEVFDGDNKNRLFTNEDGTFIKDDSFINYFESKVIVIVEEMPQDTDVAAYFEIMNNRGEQLQKHEILKANILSTIDGDKAEIKRKLFSTIWNACSRMNVPVQRSFSVGLRQKLFGVEYDDFNWNEEDLLQDIVGQNDDKGKEPTLNNILTNDFGKNDFRLLCNANDEAKDDDSEFGSIIDFPNFLMHVLKLHGLKTQGKDYPLNEKHMPTELDIKDPMAFVKDLLFYRVVLDRFIVKTNNKENEDTNWVLYSTYKANSNNALRVDRATFGPIYVAEHKEEPNVQDRIVKALSMLQVTFRTRINKNWLNELLFWFKDRNIKSVSARDYLTKIEDYMLKYFNGIFKEIFDETKEGEWKFRVFRGEATPHFLFNFIDYLYWVDFCCNGNKRVIRETDNKEIDEGSKNRNGNVIIKKDFSFKYYNSVEHHYPQHPENNPLMEEEYLQNLGNLYLISKSINSKMSNQMPIAKMEYQSDNPNRRIIYYLTETSLNKWSKEDIHAHYLDLIDLLKNRKSILQPSHPKTY